MIVSNDYARTTLYISCQCFFALFSLLQNSSISYPSSSLFFLFSPPLNSRFTPLSAPCALLIFLSHTLDFHSYNLRLLLPWTFLSFRGIFLPVCLASRHAFRSRKLLFSRATLHCDARHPVAAACSCRAAVIFGRVEQRRFGTRYSANVTPVFCFPCHRASFTPLLFSASVSHVCAFRVHGYLECTPCPEALRSAVCRDIFVYAGKLDNSMRYALWSLCFCKLFVLQSFIFDCEVLLFNSFTIRKTKIFVKWRYWNSSIYRMYLYNSDK